MSKPSESISTKGWNWGYCHFKNDKMQISHDQAGQKTAFKLLKDDIQTSQASKDTEVTVEFKTEQQTRGDILCEMRFFVPNMVEQSEKSVKDEEKKVEGDDAEQEEEDEITPAQQFNDQILKFAQLSEVAGNKIAALEDISLQVPRGKYALDFYDTYAKFHGRTHAYKIIYKDIIKVFQLPKDNYMVLLIQLKKPITQGQTMHHFVMIQIAANLEQTLKINLTQEEIDQNYNGEIQQEIDGPTYSHIATLMKVVARTQKITIPGEFKSGEDGQPSIKCSVKVSEGILYPMKTSLIFIQKPIMKINHKDIKYVEFNRIGNSSGGTGRSFDFSVYKIDTDGIYEQFKNIDKVELAKLIRYFKDAKIKMRQVNSDTNKGVDLEDFNSEEYDENLRQSQAENSQQQQQKAEPQGVTVGRSGRVRVPVGQQVQLPDDSYDDEDDESFGSADEHQSGSDQGGEEGEADMEDEIDDEVDKGELKQLKGNRVFSKEENSKRKKK